MSEQKEILDTIATISASPELREEARTNPEGLMDRLGLQGIVRQAVSGSFAVFAVGAVAAPAGWWAS